MTEQERSRKLDELLKKIEELLNLNLIAGDGLNITELHHGEFLIEQTSDTRYEALAARLLELEDRLDAVKTLKSDDAMIDIGECNGQLQVRMDENEFENRVRRIASSLIPSVPDTEQFYPFKVVRDSPDTVRILGYNEAEKRYIRNLVIAGLSPVIEVAEQTKSFLSRSGYLVLILCRNGSTYTTAVELQQSISQGDSTHYYVPLAYITVNESKITDIQQIQKGIVYISGRVV